MTVLNNKFDTNKPVLEAMYDFVGEGGELKDHDFNEVMDEFKIDDEEELMRQMMDSKDYRFLRVRGGWTVSKIE